MVKRNRQKFMQSSSLAGAVWEWSRDFADTLESSLLPCSHRRRWGRVKTGSVRMGLGGRQKQPEMIARNAELVEGKGGKEIWLWRI